MATLYEIDQEILSCIDEETGEVINLDRLNELQIERDTKIKKVAQWYKNLVDDVDAFKTNADYFAQKAKVASNKADSLKDWLTYALQGEKFTADDKTVSISYRKSERVVIKDEGDFIKQAQKRNRDDLLSYKEPTPNKTAIKQALKDGWEFSGVELIEGQNIQIK